MTYSFPTWSWRSFAAIGIGACALICSACSNAAPGVSSIQPLPNTRSANRTATRPRPAVTANYTLLAVNNTSGANNRITGIDNGFKIVGNYGLTHASYNSYTSQDVGNPPPLEYNSFPSHNYPGATGTYLAAIVGSYEAGYAYSIGSATCNPCGVIHYDQGSSSYWEPLVKDPSEGKNGCAVTALLGMNSFEAAVGYYLKGSGTCTSQAFEEYPNASGGQTYADLPKDNGASVPVATGINGKGDIVGTMGSEGWYYKDEVYHTLSCGSDVITQPLAINWSDEVVGSYEDTNLNVHGFLMTNPGSPSAVCQTIDDKHNGLTIVSSIDDTHYISGWYKDGNGNLDGFVGWPSGSSLGFLYRLTAEKEGL